MSKTHVVWHRQQVTREARRALNGHRGCVLWFTGLSGSGKSTVANLVDAMLLARGAHSMLLDGDNVRHNLSAGPEMLRAAYGDAFAERFGLGFGAMDRTENIRRLGAVSHLFCEAGLILLTAFISPYRVDRARVREMFRPGEFIEVFVDTPLAICEQRDPKGLYKKARAGEIKHFTGIDDPYEAPLSPEIHLCGDHVDQAGPEVLAEQVIDYLVEARVLRG